MRPSYLSAAVRAHFLVTGVTIPTPWPNSSDLGLTQAGSISPWPLGPSQRKLHPLVALLISPLNPELKSSPSSSGENWSTFPPKPLGKPSLIGRFSFPPTFCFNVPFLQECSPYLISPFGMRFPLPVPNVTQFTSLSH